MKLQTRKVSTVLLALLVVLFLAACGGNGDEAADASASIVGIDVLQNDNYFGSTPDNTTNPPVWEVPTGAQVTVNLENNGTLEHNWAVVAPGSTIEEPFDGELQSDIILIETGLVEGGESYSDVFTAPAPGEYIIICTVAGHYPGMQGRLIVTEG